MYHLCLFGGKETITWDTCVRGVHGKKKGLVDIAKVIVSVVVAETSLFQQTLRLKADLVQLVEPNITYHN